MSRLIVSNGNLNDPYDDIDPSYVNKINDGLKLLRVNRETNLRIATLDFTNPFPFALGSPPPIGTPTFWHYNVTFNKAFYPQANKTFEGVDILLFPKISESPESTQCLMEIYSDYFSKNFEQIAESFYWVMLKRKNSSN